MFYYYIKETKMNEEKDEIPGGSFVGCQKTAHNAFSNQEIRLLLEKYGYDGIRGRTRSAPGKAAAIQWVREIWEGAMRYYVTTLSLFSPDSTGSGD